MSNKVEMGTCQVCGKENVELIRKYFFYDLKCTCHAPNHFEVVCHCKDCDPEEPKEITVKLATKNLKRLRRA